MSVMLKSPPPHTPLQKFRALTEGFLMVVAQEEMLRKYPDMGKPPYAPTGQLDTFLRRVFLPVYSVVPGWLRQWTLRLFFVRGPQHWSKKY